MNFVRLLGCLWLLAGAARAHQVASVELEFNDLGNRWQLEGELDIAYMLPETRDVPGGLPLSRAAVMKSPPAELARIRRETETRLRQLVRIAYAGKDVTWRVDFPDFDKTPFALPEDDADTALVTTRLTVEAMPGPGELRAFWSGGQETELIILTQMGDEARIVSALPGGSVLLLKRTAGPAAPLPAHEGWVRSGFRHVIGPDHVLFILGLFLLAPRWRVLAAQSLLFTLAHSLSLALAVLGVVRVPGNWVESLIAVSIAWVGIENLVTRQPGRQRLILVFCFGLLHGLGFASVLAEKLRGVPERQLALPLLGFNLGVELAQIAILAGAFLLFLPLGKKYAPPVQTLGSAFVALAGSAWAVRQMFFPQSPFF